MIGQMPSHDEKALFAVVTVLMMGITSRFIIRIVDATVQIDDDIGLLIILLVLLNAAIGAFGYFLYKKTSRGRKS